jgi:poly(3-hydroxybutyrate) depolymerase
MRSGAKGEGVSALPTIVFHGYADQTVHPDNGENISDAAVAAFKASGRSLVKKSSAVGDSSGQNAERVSYRSDDGRSYVEHWQISEGPHAWSGGDAKGSYTDPDGPSASEAMLAFFMQHKK